MEGIKKSLKRPWPYWLGGLLLGLMNVVLLGLAGMTWQVTSGFSLFENRNKKTMILNIGVVLGSLIATLLASQFKIKRIKNIKQVVTALVGGVMMGYGAKLAVGCNIGAFFSGIPSFSLHGWVFGVFVSLGVGLGIKIILGFIV